MARGSAYNSQPYLDSPSFLLFAEIEFQENADPKAIAIGIYF